MSPLQRVLFDIKNERIYQDNKWGEQNHPDGTGPAMFTDFPAALAQPWLATNMANVAKERTDAADKAGKLTWEMILTEEVCEAFAETDPSKLREELVQVAAVAAAWVQAIDRRLGVKL